MVNRLKEMMSVNELRTFRVIYETGPISRVKLTRILHLTRAAVSGIAKRLSNRNLIMEVGTEKSSRRRGRKEVLLAVNPDSGLILAVHIALHYFTIGLVNMGGNILVKKTQSFSMGSHPLEVLPNLVDAIRAMLLKNKIDSEKILGMGVAMPGIVNYREGCLVETELEGWRNFQVNRHLQEQLRTTVIIENDVKTLTLGEYQYGTGYHVKDMICLWLEDGIGAGIVHNGQLIRGVTYSAGEIGYNEFDLDLPFKKSILLDGRLKHWGDILSFTNLEKSIRRGIQQNWKTKLKEDSTINDLISAAQAKDPLGIYIIRLVGRLVGNITLNLIYSFNPKVFILSGILFNQLPILSEEVQKVLNDGRLRSPMDTVELRTSSLGENGITVGGAALVLEHFFGNAP